MLHLAGCLQNEQAVIGLQQVDTAALRIPHNGLCVHGRVVAKKADTEIAFPLKGSMAASQAATRPPQNPHDMAFKINLGAI